MLGGCPTSWVCSSMCLNFPDLRSDRQTFAARKAAVASSNANAVIAFGKTLSAESSALAARLEEFVKDHTRLTAKLKGETEQFRTAEVEV